MIAASLVLPFTNTSSCAGTGSSGQGLGMVLAFLARKVKLPFTVPTALLVITDLLAAQAILLV